jgi:hypothetical protein
MEGTGVDGDINKKGRNQANRVNAGKNSELLKIITNNKLML